MPERPTFRLRPTPRKRGGVDYDYFIERARAREAQAVSPPSPSAALPPAEEPNLLERAGKAIRNIFTPTEIPQEAKSQAQVNWEARMSQQVEATKAKPSLNRTELTPFGEAAMRGAERLQEINKNVAAVIASPLTEGRTERVAAQLAREKRPSLPSPAQPEIRKAYEETDLPFGVKGTAELLPWLAVPGATQTRTALLGVKGGGPIVRGAARFGAAALAPITGAEQIVAEPLAEIAGAVTGAIQKRAAAKVSRGMAAYDAAERPFAERAQAAYTEETRQAALERMAAAQAERERPLNLRAEQQAAAGRESALSPEIKAALAEQEAYGAGRMATPEAPVVEPPVPAPAPVKEPPVPPVKTAVAAPVTPENVVRPLVAKAATPKPVPPEAVPFGEAPAKAAKPKAPLPEAIPPAAAPPAAKEPWMMTRQEYLLQQSIAKDLGFGGPTKPGQESWQRPIYAEHDRMVSKALAEGKPVPPEVLAEYGLGPKPAAVPAGETLTRAQAGAEMARNATDADLQMYLNRAKSHLSVKGLNPAIRQGYEQEASLVENELKRRATAKVALPERPVGQPGTGKGRPGIPPPAGPGATVLPGGPPETARILTMAQEQVRQDAPGVATRLGQRIPGIKQVLQYERPGLKMTGEKEKILVGMVGERAATSDVSTRLMASRVPLVQRLEKAFGPDVVRGTAATPLSATDTRKIGNTLLDIANNPEAYPLTAEQQSALQALQAHTDMGRQHVVAGYGAEIGRFEPKPGGAHLPNVDTDEVAQLMLGGESRAAATGRAKHRFYQTARDRMMADKTFIPELDVRKLIEASDRFKASAAGGQTYRQAVGGLTREEVIATTDPALYAKMQGLKKRLTSLKGSLGTLDKKYADTIDTFLNSAMEEVDMDTLRAALDVTLSRGPRAGMGMEALQGELNGVRAQISALRPAWAGANPKPYKFVQEGIYKYFPAEEAKLIAESRKQSTNAAIQFLERWRGQAFSGDTSPFAIQGALGILADPVGGTKAGMGGILKGIKEGDWLRPTKVAALAEDIANDLPGWTEFASLSGRQLHGTPEEFAAGFLSKIPKFDKFTEGTYVTVTRGAKDLYDRQWRTLVNNGVPELQAKVSAANIAAEVYPLINPTRLGQSQARTALLRAMPTSYSFIRQPASLMAEATTGFVKAGLKKTLTPREKLAMKIAATGAASTLAVSATSQAINAWVKGEDVEQAVLDAINPDPNNGKFASIVVGNVRIPVGGPYRSLFRAMFPGEVSGVPFPVPFAGIPRFFSNRVNPAMRAQLDLLRNQDYYGYKIRHGEWYQQVLQTLEYELEAALPLTAGSALESLRTGQPASEALQQTVAQFAGVNAVDVNSPVTQMKNELAKKTTGLDWKSLAKQDKGGLLQQQIIQANPRLQTEIDKAADKYGATNPEEGKLWLDYKNEGKTIEALYQAAVNAASQAYEQTGDAKGFKKAVEDAATKRQGAYAAREKNLNYQPVRDFYSQPLTPERAAQSNRFDLARQAYYQTMFAPDMYDSQGQYDFGKADVREQEFIRKYGQAVRDYVDEYNGVKRNWEPAPMKELRAAKQALQPYWQIADQEWAKYPPQIKALSDQWNMKKGESAAAGGKYLQSLPFQTAQAILQINAQVTVKRNQWKARNPAGAQLLRKWY